jgi:drug/metabolite transporter (DMT)-like permease
MGIAFSIGAAVFFSLSHIFVRRGVGELGVPIGTSIMLAMGSVTTILIALFVEGTQILLTASLTGLLYFAIAGAIHFVGGWGFMNASASRIGATRVSAMASLTPLFAAILAFFTLDETLNWYVATGILLITIGIYLTATSRD